MNTFEPETTKRDKDKDKNKDKDKGRAKRGANGANGAPKPQGVSLEHRQILAALRGQQLIAS